MNPYAQTSAVVLENPGFCPTCQQEVIFSATQAWLRDHYLCSNCGSIPRERALMLTIERFYPQWRELTIHESSPCGRGASVRLARECPGYLGSQFYPELAPGSTSRQWRCENLEALTFPDESFDLHVTQDVMEHVFEPQRAFREIARSLRPGGAHIFTVPLVGKAAPSRRRAERLPDGSIRHLDTPVYHGNPIDDRGSLVTTDWGYDIAAFIHDTCGLFTHVVHIDDLQHGIRAEYIEVLVTVKPAGASR
jgi:SAM-dependent methyltransferase